MRYLLLGMAMLSDIALALAVVVVWYQIITSGNGFVFGTILTMFVYRTWKDTGGFDNWKKSEIKQYLVNVKIYGL